MATIRALAINADLVHEQATLFGQWAERQTRDAPADAWVFVVVRDQQLGESIIAQIRTTKTDLIDRWTPRKRKAVWA